MGLWSALLALPRLQPFYALGGGILGIMVLSSGVEVRGAWKCRMSLLPYKPTRKEKPSLWYQLLPFLHFYRRASRFGVATCAHNPRTDTWASAPAYEPHPTSTTRMLMWTLLLTRSRKA